jgi:hypothetical protein
MCRRVRAVPATLAITLGILAMPALAGAQQASPTPGPSPSPAPATQIQSARVYKGNIADEDWSFLANRSLRQDTFDPIKYISLGGKSFLTLGGEARIRPEGFRIRGSADSPSFIDNYVFQRYLFAADWHIGQRFRVYGELQSGLLDGKVASPRPTDQNVGDLHQAFFQFNTRKDRPRQFALVVGRQEMTIGSSRLISASQGLNVKRSFDGVTAAYRSSLWSIEGGTAKLVAVTPGAFDDEPSSDQAFWGATFVRHRFLFKGGVGSGYYLGIDRQRSIYAQGIGHERRHTIGFKFSGAWKSFDFNYDVIGQRGDFSGSNINAWAVAIENGFRVNRWLFRPRFTVKVNSASGDRDPADPTLQAFNPLFPGSSYSGLVGLFGPTNLSDITAGAQFTLPRRVTLIFEMPTYFRTSARDAIYNISLQPLINLPDSRDRFVGKNPGVVAVWAATRHLTLTGVISRLLPGDYLLQSFVRHGFGFYSASITYRF